MINIKLVIGLLFLAWGCSPYNTLNKSENSYIAVNANTLNFEDSVAKSLIIPYKLRLDSTMNIVVGSTEVAMNKDNPEGLLNNLIADLTLKKANDYLIKDNKPQADICLLNSGGIRSSLPKGTITKSKIYELMPFENEIVAITISGAQTQKLFDFVARKNGMPIANCKLGIKDTTAIDVFVGGKPFDINKNYTVVTSDYLGNGGDNITFFTNSIAKVSTNKKLRDAIIEYFLEETAKGNQIKSKLDKRIYYAK